MENTLKTILRWGVFVVAVAVTTGWLILCMAYLTRLGWDGLLSLAPGDLAALLAAAAGPPVALWLTLTVMAQHQQLSVLRRAVLDMGYSLRRGLEQGEAQSRVLIEAQAASQREVAGALVPVALDDLASHVAVIAERLGVVSREDLDIAWARHGAGDRNALLRPFTHRAAGESDFSQRLRSAIAADPQSKLAAETFVRQVDVLRTEASAQSGMNVLSKVLDEGPLAQVYALVSVSQDAEAEDNADDSNNFPDVSGLSEQEPPLDDADLADRLGPQPNLFPGASAGG
jgi:hypothetical protein